MELVSQSVSQSVGTTFRVVSHEINKNSVTIINAQDSVEHKSPKIG
jgi:hypothetical protein